MIIGIAGDKESKDTVAAYLIKEHQFERLSLADPIKKAAATALTIPYQEIDPAIVDSFANGLREVLGENVWLDKVLPWTGFYSGRKIVVTELWYDNEAERIRNLAGFTVSIKKPGIFPHHIRSTLLNYQILNDCPVDALYDRIERLLVEISDRAEQVTG